MNSYFFRPHFFEAFNTHETELTLTLAGSGECLIYWGDGDREHVSVNEISTTTHTYGDNSLKTIRIYTWDKNSIVEVKLINASISKVEYDIEWLNNNNTSGIPAVDGETTLNLGGNNIDTAEILPQLIEDINNNNTLVVNLVGNTLYTLSSSEIDTLSDLSTTLNTTIYTNSFEINAYE